MWRIRRGSAAARRGRCSQEYGRHRHRRTRQSEQPNQPRAEPGLFIDDGNHDAADRWRPDRGTGPHSSAGRHHEPNAATFRAASAVDGSHPPRVVPVPTRGLFGHASVALATPAAFRARLVGYFWRSRGQRVRGVAKEAGRDPPAEAGGAAAKSVTKPPTPAGGAAQYPRQPSVIRETPTRRSPIGPLHRCMQQQLDLGRGPVSWSAHRAALTCPVKLDAEPSRGTQVASVWAVALTTLETTIPPQQG